MFLYIIIIFCILIILFILYEVYELNTLSVSTYEIKSEKISSSFNNFKIVHISDLHSKEFGKNNIKLIKKIDSLNPDVIFFSGDIIDKEDIDYVKIVNLIKELSSKYKIYYSFGNHELLLKRINKNDFVNELKKINIEILQDNMARIFKNNDYINIYGLNHNFSENKSLNIGQAKLLKNAKSSEYNILLFHDPDFIDNIKKYNIDLVFSGHIHGGIIRFGRFGVFSPNKTLFPKYICGVYNKNKTNLVVSRGLGKSKALIRINNLPEIVCVNLKNK